MFVLTPCQRHQAAGGFNKLFVYKSEGVMTSLLNMTPPVRDTYRLSMIHKDLIRIKLSNGNFMFSKKSDNSPSELANVLISL